MDLDKFVLSYTVNTSEAVKNAKKLLDVINSLGESAEKSGSKIEAAFSSIGKQTTQSGKRKSDYKFSSLGEIYTQGKVSSNKSNNGFTKLWEYNLNASGYNKELSKTAGYFNTINTSLTKANENIGKFKEGIKQVATEGETTQITKGAGTNFIKIAKDMGRGVFSAMGIGGMSALMGGFTFFALFEAMKGIMKFSSQISTKYTNLSYNAQQLGVSPRALSSLENYSFSQGLGRQAPLNALSVIAGGEAQAMLTGFSPLMYLMNIAGVPMAIKGKPRNPESIMLDLANKMKANVTSGRMPLFLASSMLEQFGFSPQAAMLLLQGKGKITKGMLKQAEFSATDKQVAEMKALNKSENTLKIATDKLTLNIATGLTPAITGLNSILTGIMSFFGLPGLNDLYKINSIGQKYISSPIRTAETDTWKAIKEPINKFKDWGKNLDKAINETFFSKDPKDVMAGKDTIPRIFIQGDRSSILYRLFPKTIDSMVRTQDILNYGYFRTAPPISNNSSSTTNVANVNVYTNTTDPKSHAEAIKNHMINTGKVFQANRGQF